MGDRPPVIPEESIGRNTSQATGHPPVSPVKDFAFRFFLDGILSGIYNQYNRV
jgi:hypothetical protein